MFDNEFFAWLDVCLSAANLPDGVVALNFNLYEEITDNAFYAELVACESYDPEDDDWACETVWESGEAVFAFTATGWKTALSMFIDIVRRYIATAPEGHPLRVVPHLTVGFVDGDLEVVR